MESPGQWKGQQQTQHRTDECLPDREGENLEQIGIIKQMQVLARIQLVNQAREGTQGCGQGQSQAQPANYCDTALRQR